MPDNPSDAVAAFDRVTVAVSSGGGRANVLDDVSFSVDRGSVYALLGRNGGGKTTAIHVLLGLLNPTFGRSRVFGRPSTALSAAAFRRIGFLPENHPMDSSLTIRQMADFYRPLYPTWDEGFFSDCMQSFSLRPAARPAQLSRGERALAALSLCVSARPEFLVLDDPTLGLDQIARNKLFSAMLKELADRGCSVLLTTHEIFSVAKVADRIGIMRSGRMVLDEPLADVLGAVKKYAIPISERAGDIPGIPGVVRATRTQAEWSVVAYCDRAESRLMAYPGAAVQELNLEELFVSMVENP